MLEVFVVIFSNVFPDFFSILIFAKTSEYLTFFFQLIKYYPPPPNTRRFEYSIRQSFLIEVTFLLIIQVFSTIPFLICWEFNLWWLLLILLSRFHVWLKSLPCEIYKKKIWHGGGVGSVLQALLVFLWNPLTLLHWQFDILFLVI